MTNLIQFRLTVRIRMALKRAGRQMIPRLSEHEMSKTIVTRYLVENGYWPSPKIKVRSKSK